MTARTETAIRIQARQQLTAVLQLMKFRPIYAWHWHCSVAGLLIQANIDSTIAHDAAARWMFAVFHIDIAALCPDEWARVQGVKR